MTERFQPEVELLDVEFDEMEDYEHLMEWEMWNRFLDLAELDQDEA